MSFDSFISGFEEYFFAKEDFESLRKIYGVILEKYPEDIDWLSRSALVYYQIGDFDQAERNAFKILELDSSYKEDIDLFLEQLKSARAEANVD
jgi:tetratricopeptide (TPR) repeat protein